MSHRLLARAGARDGRHGRRRCSRRGLGGHVDDDVIAFARTDARAVVTSDVGFGSILRYPLRSHAGIVLVRLADTEWPQIVARVVAQVAALDAADLAGNVVVIDEHRVRVRKPTAP